MPPNYDFLRFTVTTRKHSHFNMQFDFIADLMSPPFLSQKDIFLPKNDDRKVEEVNRMFYNWADEVPLEES